MQQPPGAIRRPARRCRGAGAAPATALQSRDERRHRNRPRPRRLPPAPCARARRAARGGRRRRDRPHRAGSAAQPRCRLPVPARQLLLLPDRLHRARRAARARRERRRGRAAIDPVLPREEHPEREIWEGFHYGPEAAREAFGFDAAFPNDALDAELPRLLADAGSVHYRFGASPELERKLAGWLDAVRAKARSGVAAPAAAHDLAPLLDEMRLVKDAHEQAIMRRAASISASAHRRAMAATRPGIREYEIEAELLHEFRRHGAAGARLRLDRRGRRECLRAALPGRQRGGARRRPDPDRRRLRTGRLRLRHHAHVSRQRPLLAPATRALRHRAGRAGRRRRGHARRRALRGAARGGRARARARAARHRHHPEDALRERRRRDRRARLRALLHASHRPLARHGRARLRRLPRARRRTRRAGHARRGARCARA